MKNFLLKLLTIVFALTLCLGVFSACGGNGGEPSHTHDYKTLKYDADNHWYECECGEKANGVAHVIINNSCACGYVIEHTHNYNILKYNETTHWQECTCGDKQDIEAHKGGTATTTQKAVCDICNQEYGEVLGVIHEHNFDNLNYNSNAHWYECLCGEKVSLEEHKGGVATCKEKAVCNVCNKAYGKLIDCNYVNNVCTVCLVEKTKPSEGLLFGYTTIGGVDGVTIVGIGTCTDTDIVIPKTYNNLQVLSISSNAFENKNSIKSIIIPNSVTSIGNEAFYRCTSLTSIIVDENNKNYKSIDGNLYSKDGKTLMQYAIGKTATSFEIPNSVTSIGEGAFAFCYSLTSIEIPNSVTSIGDGVFVACSLTSIEIPDSVTSIGDEAFSSACLTNIYCEAESQPSGWNSNWKGFYNATVHWGYKG